MVYAVIVVQNMRPEFSESVVTYRVSACVKSFVAAEKLYIPEPLHNGAEMSFEKCKDELFQLILRTNALVWNSGDLKTKLQRCRENEIDMWAK